MEKKLRKEMIGQSQQEVENEKKNVKSIEDSNVEEVAY